MYTKNFGNISLVFLPTKIPSPQIGERQKLGKEYHTFSKHDVYVFHVYLLILCIQSHISIYAQRSMYLIHIDTNIHQKNWVMKQSFQCLHEPIQ